jgi:hypothetical protein
MTSDYRFFSPGTWPLRAGKRVVREASDPRGEAPASPGFRAGYRIDSGTARPLRRGGSWQLPMPKGGGFLLQPFTMPGLTHCPRRFAFSEPAGFWAFLWSLRCWALNSRSQRFRFRFCSQQSWVRNTYRSQPPWFHPQAAGGRGFHSAESGNLGTILMVSNRNLASRPDGP